MRPIVRKTRDRVAENQKTAACDREWLPDRNRLISAIKRACQNVLAIFFDSLNAQPPWLAVVECDS